MAVDDICENLKHFNARFLVLCESEEDYEPSCEPLLQIAKGCIFVSMNIRRQMNISVALRKVFFPGLEVIDLQKC